MVKIRELIFGAQMSMHMLSSVKGILRVQCVQQHLKNDYVLSK